MCSMVMDFVFDCICVNLVLLGWIWLCVMDEMMCGDCVKIDCVVVLFYLFGCVGDLLEVVQVVMFLCSDVVSFVMGVDYVVDGGYVVMGFEQVVLVILWFVE